MPKQQFEVQLQEVISLKITLAADSEVEAIKEAIQAHKFGETEVTHIQINPIKVSRSNAYPSSP